MLKGIDPILNAEVLHALCAMGHGDDVIVADLNFPAHALAGRTTLGRLLRIDAGSARVARAVLSVLPLDTFADDAAGRMEVVGDPARLEPVMAEVQAEVDAAEGRSWPLMGIERYAFYERASRAFAVIQTGERRFYGCFAFRKGVIAPEGRDALIAPEGRDALIAPEERDALIAPEERDAVIAPERRNALIAPEERDAVIAPEGRDP